MATKMETMKVFKALLDGGYITEKCPVVSGKRTYRVFIPSSVHNFSEPVGHITESDFNKLCSADIIECDHFQSKDKYGNIYNRYHLRQHKKG